MHTQIFYNENDGKRYTESMLFNAGLSVKSPGVRCLLTSLPPHNSDLYAPMDSGQVTRLDSGDYAVVFNLQPLPLEVAKERLKAHVSALRYQAETGGLTLPDGSQVLTTREAQAALTSAVTRVQLKPKTSVDFKDASGRWTAMDAAAMKALGLAVTDHVEMCFSREREQHEAIEVCQTVAELEALHVDAVWYPEAAKA